MDNPSLFPTHDLVVRKDGQVTKFNAGDAIAAVIDICRLDGIRVPREARARLGRSARYALEDGFSPEEVVTALVESLRRGRIDLVGEMLLKREVIEKRGRLEPLHAPPRPLHQEVDPQFERALEALMRVRERPQRRTDSLDWGKLLGDQA